MKKFAAIIMALVMVFALAMNAGAVEIPENTIGSYEETVAVGYDDYLIESIARGSNIPSANNVSLNVAWLCWEQLGGFLWP